VSARPAAAEANFQDLREEVERSLRKLGGPYRVQKAERG
jgi:hypothetical protein